jgi:hypothetical protein
VVRRYHGRPERWTTFYILSNKEPAMTDAINPLYANPLYAKLLGETAAITWQELQPFFARGALLWVTPGMDLVEVAMAVAEDNGGQVGEWLQSAAISKVEARLAEDLLARDPQLWAVVVAPWVLIQERP